MRVHNRYGKSKPQSNVTWKIGCPVAASYREDAGLKFYRAKIVGFDDKGIQVKEGSVLAK